MFIQKKAGRVKFTGTFRRIEVPGDFIGKEYGARKDKCPCRSFILRKFVNGGKEDIIITGRRAHMSLLKNWCTLDEAESKFGVKKAVILKWVEEGLVRCEERDGKVCAINLDDLELKIDEIVKM